MIDFILHIDTHLATLSANYGIWIYAILFLIIFCETGLVVTPFLPGDSLLFASGAVVAASAGGLNIHVMVMILLLAAVLGDAVNFVVGKYFGEKLFAQPDSRVFKPEYLTKTHDFYAKYGGKTIILARFVPIVRTFCAICGWHGQNALWAICALQHYWWDCVGGIVDVFGLFLWQFGGCEKQFWQSGYWDYCDFIDADGV